MKPPGFLRQAKYVVKTRLFPSPIEPSTDEQYKIRPGYRHRVENGHHDDIGFEDEFQREVYELALQEADEMGAKTVFDVGCGSGFKLIKFFNAHKTIGFDLPPTVEALRRDYPDRDWRTSDFDDPPNEAADLVMCADVVEHVPDPTQLMEFLSRLKFEKLYLSTPERRLMYGFDQSGPPGNGCHCREWMMDEFRAFVEQWFVVERHLITNRRQATQLAICLPRKAT